MGRLSKRDLEIKKEGKGGGRAFKRFRSHIILKYTPVNCCEIEDLVETHLCNIVCDTPIVRINHICRGLLHARCKV